MSASYDTPFCRAEYWVSGGQMLDLTQSQQTAVGKHKIYQKKKRSVIFLAFFPFRIGWKGSSLWSLFILEFFFLLRRSILIAIIQRWGQQFFSAAMGYQGCVICTFHLIKQFLSNSSEYLVFHGFDWLPFLTESYSEFLSSLNMSILVIKCKWLYLFVEKVGQDKSC